MYLAKVHIAPAKSNNAYELHRALWQLFPDRPNDNRTFLFRVESLSRAFGAQVLMQSHLKPADSGEHVRCLATKVVNYQFQQGQQLRFRLRCNPVKAVKDERKGTVTRNGRTHIRSVRVPLISEEQQQQWLSSKLKQSGVCLQAVNIVQENPLYFRKTREKRSGKVQPVLFEGLVLVDDPTALQTAVVEGIGPAKSFGMGLLSLAAC
ncbi:type I-E CRISPR-associated protein Cas6/Cse3/CasE [Endozoicomonas sp. SESOKO4]|uniref:type I-E CRISPR-associated protein Cas6/Cse3/CasE n=1 Tax=Endozoicomonas sp. SESOKO4 TaxID=2828745 RepID=UPI002147DEE4|nr:type I-E CRISPR-associated protein Cas6/Cse3/CasE [Endozoicomonas sp. SESOKO4]